MKILNIKVKKLAHLFGIIWIGSIIVFFGLIFISQFEKVIYNQLVARLLIASFIFGVLSFALAAVLYFLHFVNSDNKQVKKKIGKKKNNDFANVKHRVLVSSVVGLSIIGILLLVALFAKSTSIISGSSMERTPTSSIEATDAPVIESPTPTTAPVYVPPIIVPTVDPDPLVSCNMSSNCGGGTTPLRQSECANSTCCQIGGKWIFYKDKNQCVQDQNTYWANYYKNNSNYTIPTNNYVPPASSNYQPSYQEPTVNNSSGYNTLPANECKQRCDSWGFASTSIVLKECYAKCGN